MAILIMLSVIPAAAANEPARHVASETEFWATLEREISSTLLPLAPDVDALRLDLAIGQGERACGSGTLSLAKGGHALLTLSAPGALFRYLAVGATATCLLDLGGTRTLFVSGPGRQVPVPVVRLDKSPDERFSMNIMMNLAALIATKPIDIGVDPGAPAYIVKKLRETNPWCVETASELRFAPEQAASPAVIISRSEGRVTGFELVFPQEGASAVRVRVDPLAIGTAAVHPEITTLFPPGRIPEPGADTLVAFMQGFYAVLSGMIPR